MAGGVTTNLAGWIIDGLLCLLDRYFFSIKPLVLKVGDGNIIWANVFLHRHLY